MLGALLGLDVVSFPQAMISRPIVAATVAGAFIGHANAGVLIGVTLELIALATLPFGASRYPEWGSAGVVGGAIAAALRTAPAGTVTAGVLATLITAWVGGWTLVKLRQWNAWLARRKRDALEAGARGTVVGLQLTGLTSDLLRAMVLTAVAYALLFPVARAAVAHWSFNQLLSRAVTVGAAGAVAAAAA